MSDVIVQIEGRIGCITLNRPKALNALSLDMVRALTRALRDWQTNDQVLAVAVRGTGKERPFGAFCAGVISVFSIRQRTQAMLRWVIFSPKNTA